MKNTIYSLAGVVPKSEGQMEEEGAHQKGPGPACTQRSSSDLFRRADTRGRAPAQGTRTEAEKVAQELGEAAEEVGRQRSARGLGYVAQGMGVSTSQQ